jgi:hypothetical protein
MITQDQVEKMAEALRNQGLTWTQTNFAISLVRNAVDLEREACAKVCDSMKPFGPELALQKATMEDCAAAIRARGQQ